MKNKAEPVELRLIAVVDRRVGHGAEEDRAPEPPAAGAAAQLDSDEEPAGPALGGRSARKPPRYTQHVELVPDRHLKYPGEPGDEPGLGGQLDGGGVGAPGVPVLAGPSAPPDPAGPLPLPVAVPPPAEGPAPDPEPPAPVPSGDQLEEPGPRRAPALEPSLATVPLSDLDKLECTAVQGGGSSDVRLTFEMGSLRHNHPLLRRLACPYTHALQGLLPTKASKIVGNMNVLDEQSLCTWFSGECVLVAFGPRCRPAIQVHC